MPQLQFAANINFSGSSDIYNFFNVLFKKKKSKENLKKKKAECKIMS